MNSTIDIALAFDSNYWNQFCALISSVLANKRSERINFHFIAPDISRQEQETIVSIIEKHDCYCNFHEIDEKLVNQYIIRSHYTPAVYYRLFFPLLLKDQCKKLLYIDTDTIVVNSLSSFFAIDLQGYPVGAVYDNYVKRRPEIGITTEGEYFNSGVLIIDIETWNDQKISELTMDYLENYPQNIHYVDQCALNAVLKNNWKKLTPNHNMMYTYVPWDLPFYLRTRFLKNVFVVHYTLQRPWTYLCRSPLRFLYHKYLNKSDLKIKRPVISDKNKSDFIPWLQIRFYELYSIFKMLKSFK